VPAAVGSLVLKALFGARTRATLQLEDLDGDDGDAMNTATSAPGRTLYFHGRATLFVNGYCTEARKFSIAVPPP
jgi:hypothetical protein